MIDIKDGFPPEHCEILAQMTDGKFAVVSYHPDHPEKWWPGEAYFGEYGYEACVSQNVAKWILLNPTEA
jgi:hypothetical protein